ncbi:transposase [Burkholderia glumae]|nr:transposase [Burkholderia glumae]MCQ0034605.1 transposase [Burkholderia glumae]MCQ0040084.1 transposase [Burkholderia glumae]
MDWETSFELYLEHLCEALGHNDRESGLRGYCQGLMLPIRRKSVEPLAAHLEPEHVSARHQSLHHFVAKSEWSDTALLEQVRRWVLPHMDPTGGLYWIIDDKGFPKKGKHSVGVARQYCGQLGKQYNCQVAVSLSVATQDASLPVSYRLYKCLFVHRATRYLSPHRDSNGDPQRQNQANLSDTRKPAKHRHDSFQIHVVSLWFSESVSADLRLSCR